ncbi:unnamed protein product [Polarella glacialis]|uniref:Integrase catalytic domain-containing protein n=1 Tax=Polarella glacialis TaxID=89957 RepID=A0A813KZF4_POLGL|nr:unnamed protein product [Polarella glacialis]
MMSARVIYKGKTLSKRISLRSRIQFVARTGGPKPVPHPMPIEDEAIVGAAVKQLHTNLGHPENRSLARAIRLTGGSHLAIKTALDFQCPVCKRIAEPKPTPSRSLRRWQNFGDCVAVDLFSLADCHGHSLTFLNAIDMASRYQVVTFVPSKSPLVIYKAFMKTWVTPFGVPKAVLTDLGGEFNREFSQELSDLGSQMLTSAAISPTQNAVAERAGGLWKLHARAVLDEFSIDYHQTDRLDWLCATVSWAHNARVDETGYSPSQWVLGCGIRLPYQLWGSNLALQSRMEQDHTFADRVATQAAAQRSTVGLHYSRALSRAFLARARTSQPAAASFAVGDQVYYWRGIGKRGVRFSNWAFRWHGPCVVIGHEQNNIWVAHRGSTLKCAARHLRHALPEELLPWRAVVEEQMAAQHPDDEQQQQQQYYDLTPPPATDLSKPTHRVRGKQPQPPTTTADGAAVPEEEMGGGDVLPPSAPPPGPPPADFDSAGFDPDQPPEEQEQEFDLGSDFPWQQPPVFREPTAEELRADEGDLYDTPLGQEEERPQAPEEEMPPSVQEEEMPPFVQEEETPSFQPGAGDAIVRHPPDLLERPAKVHRTACVFVEYDTLLVGKARAKEVQWALLNGSQKQLMQEAMSREWQKWTEHKSVRWCSVQQLQQLRQADASLRVIGTRWVLTQKADGTYKARLVVQGCQENHLGLRVDAPTGSVLAFTLTLLFGAQNGWDIIFGDAACAFLQSQGIERLLLIKLPAVPPPGTVAGQILIAQGSIYGTRDAPRAWYGYLQKTLVDFGFRESWFEKGFYILPGTSGPAVILMSHVDDLCIAFDTQVASNAQLLKNLEHKLQLSVQKGDSMFCGKWVQFTHDAITVTQPRAAQAVEQLPLTSDRRKTPDALLTPAEVTSYRGVIGQLMWLVTQTRPDLAVGVNQAAQHTTTAKVSDAIKLNSIAREANSTAEIGLVFRRGLDLSTARIVGFGDSAFANAEGYKSQAGYTLQLTQQQHLTTLLTGNFQHAALVSWHTGTIKRVVRSTLAAEAYAVSEVTEAAQLLRELLAEIRLSVVGSVVVPSDVETAAAGDDFLIVTDSQNVAITVPKDSTALADKRLRIVVAMLRQVFCKDSHALLKWVPTKQMLADALTKLMTTAALRAAMQSIRHSPPGL